MVKICLLSPRTVILKDNKEVNFPTNKCRNLFSYLLLNREKRCLRNKLAYTLWPDYPEERARRNLNNSIWLLKKMFKEELIKIEIKSESSYLSLEIDQTIVIDIDQFYQLIDLSKDKLNIDTKTAFLKKAISLGDNILFEEDQLWLDNVKIHFNTTFMEANAELINVYKLTGQYHKAIDLCTNFLKKEPFDETFIYQLILLFHLSDKNSKAVQKYKRYTNRLKDELDIEPGRELVQLIETITKRKENFQNEGFDNEGDNKVDFFEELPLIGREKEIDCFKELLLNSIRNKKLSCLFLKGIAGIGKSRFSSELVNISKLFGIKVLETECIKLNNPPSFNLINSLLEKILEILPDEKIHNLPLPYSNILLYFIPELGEQKSSISNINNAFEEHGRFEYILFYKTISYLLREVVDKKPLVIIIEDIQWADQESLNLLGFLCNDLKNKKIIIVQTARSEDISEPLKNYFISIRESADHIQLKEIDLQPLSLVQIDQFIQTGLKLEENTLNTSRTDLADMFLEETGGIPLVIMETLRYWQQRNLITYQPASKAWNIADLALSHYQKTDEITEYFAISDKLNLLYQSRLSQLNDNLIDIIQLAAVIGFRFDKEVIYQLLNKPEHEFVFAFDYLISLGIFVDLKEERKIQFSHLKLREYVYNSMTDLKRKYFHKELCHYLKSTKNSFVRRNEAITKIAWHSYQAGLLKDALKYNLLSALDFQEKGVIFKAIHYLNRAADLYDKISEDDPETLITIYKEQGKINFSMGKGKKAIEILTKALTLTEKNNLLKAEVELYSLLARVFIRIGDFEGALSYIQYILKIKDKVDLHITVEALFSMSLISLMSNNSDLAVTVRNELNRVIDQFSDKKDDLTLGRVLFIQGQHYLYVFDQVNEAVASFKKAEAIFRSMQEKENLAMVLAYTGFCFHYHNLSSSWPVLFEESLKLAKTINNIHVICSILGPIITTYLNSGEYGKALKIIEEYPTRGANRTWIIPLLAVKGEIYCWLGDNTNAFKFLNQSLKYCKNTKIPDYKNDAISTLGFINGLKRDLSQGEKLLTETENIARNIPLNLRIGRVRLKKMLLALYTGNFTSLPKESLILLETGKKAGIPFIIAWGYFGQGISSISEGELIQAEELLNQAVHIARQNRILSLYWQSESALGDLYLIKQDHKEAKEHYHQAAGLLEDIFSQLPEESLQKKFLTRPEVKKTIIRGQSKILEKDFFLRQEINSKDSLQLLTDFTTEYDRALARIVEKNLGKVVKRRFQLLGILLESEALDYSLKSKTLATFFQVHVRTIERDIKAIGLSK